MTELARTRTVLYIDTIGVRTPRLSARDTRRAVGKIRRSVGGIRRVSPNLHVWSPLAIPFHGSELARRLNADVLARLTQRMIRRLRMGTPIVYTALPSAFDIATRIPRSCLVYHCVDDYREFTDAPRKAYEAMEDRLLHEADLTVVSSTRLLALRSEAARKIVYLPHGTDTASFARSLGEDRPLPDIDRLATPIAGFVGRVGDWIDVDLMFRCARDMPDWSFVVIGPTNIDLARFEGLPNLVFLGLKQHEEIPHYIKRFSVGLLPFVANDVSASVNPLKLYEYLAIGTPVVSTPSLDMSEFADVVDVSPADGFGAAIREAERSDSAARQAGRRLFVERYSWASVADRFTAALEDAVVARPQTLTSDAAR